VSAGIATAAVTAVTGYGMYGVPLAFTGMIGTGTRLYFARATLFNRLPWPPAATGRVDRRSRHARRRSPACGGRA
jgi:hypothetical protein